MTVIPVHPSRARRAVTSAAAVLAAVAVVSACAPSPTVAPKLPTVVSVSSLNDTASTGDAVVLFAGVVSSGGGTPTGTVSFFDDDLPIATITLTGGNAAAPNSFTIPGGHVLLAKYSGDSHYEASSSGPTSISIRNLKQIGISAGGHHTCALREDGTVRCWGNDSHGQLGDGTHSTTGWPTLVSGIEGATAISAGGQHTCAILADATVKCWGLNSNGQLGDGTFTDSSVPVLVAGLTGVKAISAGATHTCAAMIDTTVECWGDNTHGQLGNGTTTSSATPVVVSFMVGATKVAAGEKHSCVVLSGGTLWCWGDNSAGQLGNGSFVGSIGPVMASGITDAKDVTAGGSQTCAVVDDGSLNAYCWGAGRTANPVVIGFVLHPLSAGSAHVCGILRNSVVPAVKCWGDNDFGQLGDATTVNGGLVVNYVPAGFNTLQISAGGNHTCELLTDHSVRCWGDNSSGELGTAAGASSATAVTVQHLSYIDAAVSISGGKHHTCMVIWDSTVRCWGDNEAGALGRSGPGVATPLVTPGNLHGATLTGVVQVSAGDWHTCALLSDATVSCWGDDTNGKTPNGNNGEPETIHGLVGATAVSAGGDHTCALLADRTVSCWGLNDSYQLGFREPAGTLNPYSAAPVPIPGLTDVEAISAGDNYTCALIAGGTVTCWGAGQLLPLTVPGVSGVTALSAEYLQTCGLSNGTAVCWIGTGREEGAHYQPSTVAGLSGALTVSTSTGHGCAVVSDGVVKCWGENDAGQLGFYGNSAGSYPPQAVAGLGAVTAVVTGSSFSCALLFAGSVSCWGDNSLGKLGTASAVASDPVPHTVVGF